MLNELNRCPKELYKHLSDEDKEEFKIDLTDEAQNNLITNNRQLDDSEVETIIDALTHITSLKRNEDRFPYFALRFLDESNTLERIRFQLHIGKMSINEYDKTMLGKVINRKIEKEVHAFGKIGEFIGEEREDEYLSLIAANHPNKSKVYFTQYAPHYHFTNNKIGLFIFDKANDSAIPLFNVTGKLNQTAPTAFLSVHILPKLVLLEMLKKGAAERLIKTYSITIKTFFDKAKLDTIKMPLAYTPESFYRRIEKNVSPELWVKWTQEDKQRKEYLNSLQERKAILATALANKKIKITQLPNRIKDYLMGIEDTNPSKLAAHNVKTWKKEIAKRIKDFENGKSPKIGEMATFIAKDIIDMMIDKEAKQKITSVYYNQLQNALAYYGEKKQIAIDLCKELGVFDRQKGHVFLKPYLFSSANGILAFYADYIYEKERWIKRNLVRTEVVKGKRMTLFSIPNDGKTLIPYSLLQAIKPISDFEDWLQAAKSKPIDLPNDLFDDELEKLLKVELAAKGISYNEKDTFAKLLQSYQGGDTQPFYNYGRKYYHYEEDKEIYIETDVKDKELVKRYGNKVAENQKLLRFTQTKDRVIKEMCIKLLKSDADVIDAKEQFTLHLDKSICLDDIYPKSPRSPLNQAAVFKQSKNNKIIIAQNTERNDNEVKAWNEQSALFRLENPKEKKGYVWTIKDFGTFKRFATDRRLPDLLPYFEEKEIPYTLLKFELDEYDRYREQIFDLVFQIEKAIAQKDEVGLIALANDRTFAEIQFEPYLTWIKNSGISTDDNISKYIKEVRNKFSHSQFPAKNITQIPTITKSQQSLFESSFGVEKAQLSPEEQAFLTHYRSISAQILEKFQLEVSDLVQKIQNMVL